MSDENQSTPKTAPNTATVRVKLSPVNVTVDLDELVRRVRAALTEEGVLGTPAWIHQNWTAVRDWTVETLGDYLHELLGGDHRFELGWGDADDVVEHVRRALTGNIH